MCGEWNGDAENDSWLCNRSRPVFVIRILLGKKKKILHFVKGEKVGKGM